MTVLTDVMLTQLEVLDSTIAYREAGDRQAPVVLFLHGNPTSSYIWRNILPLVASVGPCIAPDLIGFGQSGKPEIDYRFGDHVRYLDAFLDRTGITSAFVVAQDWGSALAFHLLRMCKQIVINPSAEDRRFHGNHAGLWHRPDPAVQFPASRAYLAFLVHTASRVLHAIADRLLVNIQSDVVHVVSEEPPRFVL